LTVIAEAMIRKLLHTRRYTGTRSPVWYVVYLLKLEMHSLVSEYHAAK
jgi:hypothetical protein